MSLAKFLCIHPNTISLALPSADSVESSSYIHISVACLDSVPGFEAAFPPNPQPLELFEIYTLSRSPALVIPIGSMSLSVLCSFAAAFA